MERSNLFESHQYNWWLTCWDSYTRDMRKDELYKLLKRYESPSEIELSKALDAIKQLKEDNQISEDLAKNLIKLLISKHIHNELANEMRLAMTSHGSPKILRFMNFK